MPTNLPFDRPPYDVIAVFDPDGETPSFAYTVGVFEAYGVPELFAWSVPDAGIDPGERWELSASDLHMQLTDAVQRLRDAAVPPTCWEHELDGGRSVLRSTLYDDNGGLPTYALPAGIPLRRLHLELVRPPVGRPSPLSAVDRRAVVARTQNWARVLRGLPLPAVSAALRQPYGPGTSGVGLLLDLVASADEELLQCVASLECCSQGGTLAALAELDAVARTAGRGGWVRRAQSDVDARLSAQVQHLPQDERDELDAHVGTALRCAVTAWVMVDLVDGELFRRATASVRAAITRSGGPEDQEPAPVELVARATALAAELAAAGGLSITLGTTLEALRAIWLMAWTGRGGALMTAMTAAGAGAEHLLGNDRAWELLSAVLVLDVAPDLVTLLPPRYRAA